MYGTEGLVKKNKIIQIFTERGDRYAESRYAQASKQARHNCALFEHELNSHQMKEVYTLSSDGCFVLFSKESTQGIDDNNHGNRPRNQ